MSHSVIAPIVLASIATLAVASGCQVHGGAGLGATLRPSMTTGVETGPPERPVAGQASASVEVRISFFGVPLGGANDVVFVLDRSGSMGMVSAGVSGKALGMSKTEGVLASLGGTVANSVAGAPLPTKLEAAQEELIRALNAMPDGTRFGVVFFDQTINAMARSMWTLDPHTRQSATSFIRGIEPGGSTAAVPAMRLAYQMGAQRVVLLSDGLANSGGNGGDLMTEARAHIRAGLRIDTVGLGLDQDDALLQSLANESGGLAVMR